MQDYYDDLWHRLPDNLVPSDLGRRWRFLAPHLRPGLDVLDLGCGDGTFAELMLERAPLTLTLADVASAALARARARPGLSGEAIRLVQVPFDGDLPLADNAFDLVWAGEVIEHVADTARWLSEVRRVLRPGGELLLSTPDHSRLTLAWRGVAALSPPLGDHLHLYDRRGLRGLLDLFGFSDVEVRTTGRLWRPPGLLLARARR